MVASGRPPPSLLVEKEGPETVEFHVLHARESEHAAAAGRASRPSKVRPRTTARQQQGAPPQPMRGIFHGHHRPCTFDI
uniref:Uncharacterized protein n=1 Tax=Setaria italica TaxID=4555 RepID=A0A0Q3RZR7_SETIT